MKNLYGLLGEHLSHSLSPMIHNQIFNYLDIDGYYHLFEVDNDNLKDAINGFKALKLKGVNVTIPYKQKVMEYLDEISDEALKIGAVNTISFNNGKTIGYNTDYFGFGLTLDKFNIDIKNKKVIILGTGGASKAILQSISDRNASEIIFVSRHPQQVIHSVDNFSKKYTTINYDELIHIKGDIIINCTPVGMYPQIEDCPVIHNYIGNFSTAVDIIYNPYKTKFLKYAEEYGLKTVNGLYMLVAQAVKAHEFWNNTKIDTSIIDKIYSSLLNIDFNNISNLKINQQNKLINRKNIVLIGMPGCGKTTIGKILSQKLNIPFFDVDKYIEDNNQMSIDEMFNKSEDYFRDIESLAIKQVSKTSPKVISTGGGVIKRTENIDELKKTGTLIFINRPLENIINDINTETRPLLKDDTTALEKLYYDRISLYKEYCDFEISNDKSLDETLQSIMETIRDNK